MRYPVKGIGSIGLVKDLPAEEIALGAWTSGRNVRFKDGAVEKFTGHTEVLATPLVAPHWLMPVNTGASNFWLYAGAAKVGATDGATHADITRAAGGDYATDLNNGWSGTIIEGIPVIANGTDTPQMWVAPSLVNDLTPLTAWPANTVAHTMRGLKRYLVALDITKVATRYPFMVKWSDRAPPGGVPPSWDETDPTRDAGEYTLPSEGGSVVDAFPLRDLLAVYKESEVWLMQLIGGNDIFAFRRVFETFGCLTRRCATPFQPGKHLVFTIDDLVVHDGQQADSILDGKARQLLAGQVNPSAYQRSFIVSNYGTKEVWACFAEAGHTLPSMALVWNWRENLLGLRELADIAFISPGVVDPIDPAETWAGAVGDWASDSVAWGDRSFDPSQRRMLMAAPNVTKLYRPDTTRQFAGVNMTAFVERINLGYPLKQDAPPDFGTRKQWNGCWPRITGTQGGIVNVYIGTQEKVDGPIAWDPARPYTIGSSSFIDFVRVARLFALRFESTTDIDWRLRGYDVDIVEAGE